ncbi:MAG: hypothetical protein Q8K70_00120, partial [Bacteroidota bacterium]|nr:hypothetical protein [Bacteroidota bacterium]
MKKILLKLILLIAVFVFIEKINAQNIVYSDTFTNGAGYSSGSSQWDNWASFRNSLDTSNQTLLKVTMKGTFDQTGRTCTDRTIVRRLAMALRNAGTYNATCDNYVWSVGNCGSGPELNVNTATSICWCNNGWCLRPQINPGNPNWGGVNSNTCSGPTQRLTVIFEKPSKPNDMGVVGLTRPDLCNYTQTLVSRISNFGTTTIDSFRLYWSINGVLQTPMYIQSRLGRNKDTSITLFNNYNFTANSNYTFKVWTHRPNNQTDSIAENDTLRYSFFFLGNPNAPSVTDFTQCGNGFPRLVGTPNSSLDSILWFNQSSGGSLLGIGRNIQGPYLTQSSTFYAQAAKFGGLLTLRPTANTAVNVNQSVDYGGMLSVTVNQRVFLDSMLMRMWYNVLNTNLTYQVYYRIGTFNGFQTNASAWTLLSQGPATLFQRNGLNYARVPTNNFVLEPSTTYSFYFVTIGNCVACQNNGQAVSDANMTIAGGGSIIIGQFGSQQVLNNWHPEMAMMYKVACESSTRVPLTVTVKPRPTGASVVTGTPFQGQVKLGIPSSPDIIELGKTLTYELNPPTGFTNADHGITWTINSVVARTRYNVVVPDTQYTLVAPSPSGPGTLTYIPRSQFLDSFITF